MSNQEHLKVLAELPPGTPAFSDNRAANCLGEGLTILRFGR